VEAGELTDRALGQDLAGPQVTVATEIEMRGLVFEAGARCGGPENLDGFRGDLRAGAIAGNDCDLVHVDLLWTPARPRRRWRRILSHAPCATSSRADPGASASLLGRSFACPRRGCGVDLLNAACGCAPSSLPLAPRICTRLDPRAARHRRRRGLCMPLSSSSM